jgi:hypothetical protein
MPRKDYAMTTTLTKEPEAVQGVYDDLLSVIEADKLYGTGDVAVLLGIPLSKARTCLGPCRGNPVDLALTNAGRNDVLCICGSEILEWSSRAGIHATVNRRLPHVPRERQWRPTIHRRADGSWVTARKLGLRDYLLPGMEITAGEISTMFGVGKVDRSKLQSVSGAGETGNESWVFYKADQILQWLQSGETSYRIAEWLLQSYETRFPIKPLEGPPPSIWELAVAAVDAAEKAKLAAAERTYRLRTTQITKHTDAELVELHQAATLLGIKPEQVEKDFAAARL